jgi:hypothetical protein
MCYKTFLIILYCYKDRVLVTVSHSNPILIFAGKDGANPSGLHSMRKIYAFLSNIRIGRKVTDRIHNTSFSS